MQAPQAGGIARSLQKLARPIATMAQIGSTSQIETSSIAPAPAKPTEARSLRAQATPMRRERPAVAKPETKQPMPPKNSGSPASSAPLAIVCPRASWR